MGNERFLASLIYVDVELLLSAVSGLVQPEVLYRLPRVKCIRDIGEFIPGVIPWLKDVLHTARLHTLDYALCWSAEAEVVPGDLIYFDGHFRTKNVGYWGVNRFQPGLIYMQSAKRCLSLAIDPRWVFGDHGYHELTSGWVYVGGLFVLEAACPTGTSVIGRPILLGLPSTECHSCVFPGNNYFVAMA